MLYFLGMNYKENIVKEIRRHDLSCSVAYFNMLLAGTRNASYPLGYVLSKIMRSSVDVWCNPKMFIIRKGYYQNYKNNLKGQDDNNSL